MPGPSHSAQPGAHCAPSPLSRSQTQYGALSHRPSSSTAPQTVAHVFSPSSHAQSSVAWHSLGFVMPSHPGGGGAGGVDGGDDGGVDGGGAGGVDGGAEGKYVQGMQEPHVTGHAARICRMSSTVYSTGSPSWCWYGCSSQSGTLLSL